MVLHKLDGAAKAALKQTMQHCLADLFSKSCERIDAGRQAPHMVAELLESLQELIVESGDKSVTVVAVKVDKKHEE